MDAVIEFKRDLYEARWAKLAKFLKGWTHARGLARRPARAPPLRRAMTPHPHPACRRDILFAAAQTRRRESSLNATDGQILRQIFRARAQDGAGQGTAGRIPTTDLHPHLPEVIDNAADKEALRAALPAKSPSPCTWTARW